MLVMEMSLGVAQMMAVKLNFAGGLMSVVVSLLEVLTMVKAAEGSFGEGLTMVYEVEVSFLAGLPMV